MSRLTGDRYLATNSTSVESSFNFDNLFDDMTGWTLPAVVGGIALQIQ